MKSDPVMCNLRPRYWIKILLWFLAWIGATTVAAQAHPHVWATIETEVLFAPNGAATAVRHIWTFDDMYSAFATTGLKAKTAGLFTRQELQPLAQVNVESLKDFGFFTFARINGKRQKDVFKDPVDYWLDYDAKSKQLTLHLTLPFKNPVAVKQLLIEVYDPEFFVDFGPAEKDPVRLVGAPPQCTVTAQKPPDQNFVVSSQSLSQLFTNAEANIGMGMNFSNKILVKCP
jgi:ABC-type uncharacterized transport system substrate-binding protein